MERRHTHPLDVDLLSFVAGDIDDYRSADIERHTAECLLCRVRIARLRQATLEGEAPGAASVSVPTVSPAVQSMLDAHQPTEITGSQLWLAGDSARTLVWISEVSTAGEYAHVFAATLDIAGADNTALIATVERLAANVAIFTSVTGTVPLSALRTYVADLAVGDDLHRILEATATGKVATGVLTGTVLDGAIDERREFRQLLADSLAILDPIEDDGGDTPDDDAGTANWFCQTLIEDFLPLREPCSVIEPYVRHADWSLVPHMITPVAWVRELDCQVLVALDNWYNDTPRDDWSDLSRFVIAVGGPTLALAAIEPPHMTRLFELRHLHSAYELPAASNKREPRPLGDPLPVHKALYGYFEAAALHTTPDASVPHSESIDAFVPDYQPFATRAIGSLRAQRAQLGKLRALRALSDNDADELAEVLGRHLAHEDLVAELDRITHG